MSPKSIICIYVRGGERRIDSRETERREEDKKGMGLTFGTLIRMCRWLVLQFSFKMTTFSMEKNQGLDYVNVDIRNILISRFHIGWI